MDSILLSDVDHVSHRWLTTLVRYADGRKMYPDLTDQEFEQKAHEYLSVITVGTQADLYFDPFQFESARERSIAEKIRATPLPDLKVTREAAKVKKLQEKIRSYEASYHSTLSTLAWRRHDAGMRNTHVGTLQQLEGMRDLELQARLKTLPAELAEARAELDTLVTKYGPGGINSGDSDKTVRAKKSSKKGEQK